MWLKHQPLWAISAIVLLMGGGAWLGHHFTSPQVITRTVENTKEVKVEVPVLTTKVVDRVITDPKQQVLVNKLLKENKELKLNATNIGSTTGSLVSSNSGVPTRVSDTAGTGTNGSKFSFHDYQLSAQYDSEGKEFNYTLSQSFSVVTSTGRDKNGDSVGLVRVYQNTPTGAKLIPTETTELFADEALAKWIVSPRVQAGLSMNQDKVKSGVVILQWLKHGKSKDPKDLAFAVLSPSVIVDNTGAKIAIAPLSINLGHLPKQPFSNIWVSGMIDTSKKLSVAITATF